MFRAAYDSPWQDPGVAWLAGAPLLTFALLRLARSPPQRRATSILFLLLELEIVLDAWLHGPLSPVAANSVASSVAGAGFIVLGDLRFFYLIDRQRTDDCRVHSLLLALGVSLIVPLATGLGSLLFPGCLRGNTLYLVYELLLLALIVGFARWRWPPQLDKNDPRARYLRHVLALELALYAGWVIADVLILVGIDLGWALRMIPNALYYAAFAPLAALSLPREARV